MILTNSFLSKAGFLGSIFNRCRQVTNILSKTSTDLNDENNTKQSPNHTSPSPKSTVTFRSPLVTTVSFKNPSAGLKTLEEKVGLPRRPKKPLTPYFRYMVDIRSKMLAEQPTLSLMEAVRAISKKWKTIDPNIKQRLEEEYNKEKEIYVEQRAKYDAKITDHHRSEMKRLKEERTKAKERKQLRQRIKDLGRPKRPLSAFLRFINQQRIISPHSPPQTYREWYQKCTDQWAKLSEKEKEKLIAETRMELEKYKKDMSSWEEKMVLSGNIDLIRYKGHDPELMPIIQKSHKSTKV